VTVRLPTDLPRDVVAMSGVAFCVALGFGVVAPAIPLFAAQFGVDAAAAGAGVAVFALMRLLSGLLAGRVVDALGERTSLMIGVAVVGLSSLLAGLSENYPQLLALRGVGGVGSAVFGVAAMSLVLRVASQRMRGRAVSVYRGGFLVGGIAGPAVGGAVLGISLRAPFFLYAGTLALAGVVAMVFVSRPQPATARAGIDHATDLPLEPDPGSGRDPAVESPPVHDGEQPDERVPVASSDPSAGRDRAADEDHPPEATLRDLLGTREYQAALVTNLAVGLAVLGLRSTVVPLLFVHHLQVDVGWVGAAFVSSALVQTALMFPAGRFTDTIGRRAAIVLGSTVAAVGMLMLAVASSLVIALIAMGVFGAGSAFLGTAPAALVGDVAGKRSGQTIAVFNMASDFGAVTGPVLAGWLVDQGSYAAAFGMGAGVLLVAGALGLRLPSSR
jgi:MFS family permease